MSEVADWLTAYDLTPPVTVFALPAQGRNNRAVGVRTGAGEFIFKTYLRQGEAALRYEQALLTWLGAQALPFAVPAAVPTRAGEALLATPDGWAALMPYLPGRPVDTSQLAEVEAMGAALGALHQALARYTSPLTPSLPPCATVLRQHAALATLTLETTGLAQTPENVALLGWWQNENAALLDFSTGADVRLPRQVIHRDFDPSNTLVTDGRLTGVLDFEFAGPDWRALDVASALKYTLRWWEGVDPWPVATAFLRGYSQRQRLTAAEISALPWLVRVRDAAVTLLRLAPAVAAREGELVQVYLQQAHDSAAWLNDHAGRLIAIARDELGEPWTWTANEGLKQQALPRAAATANTSLAAVMARLAAHPAVEGLLTIGSTGSGALTPASDYDLIVVIRKAAVPLSVALTTIEQRLTDVIFVATADLAALLEEPIAERPQWQVEQVRRWLRTGQIVYDRAGQLARTQARALATSEARAGDGERYAAWFSINYNWQQTRRMAAATDPNYQTAVDLRLLYSIYDLWRFYFVIRQLSIYGEKAQSHYLAIYDQVYLTAFRQLLKTASRTKRLQRYEQVAALTTAPLGGLWPAGMAAIMPDASEPWDSDTLERAQAFWQELMGEAASA